MVDVTTILYVIWTLFSLCAIVYHCRFHRRQNLFLLSDNVFVLSFIFVVKSSINGTGAGDTAYILRHNTIYIHDYVKCSRSSNWALFCHPTNMVVDDCRWKFYIWLEYIDLFVPFIADCSFLLWLVLAFSNILLGRKHRWWSCSVNKNNKHACYFVFVYKIGSEYNGHQFILYPNIW